MVAGMETPASEVLRAALQLIGTRDGIDTVSSSFIVVTDMMQFGNDGVFVVGDGDVIPDPDEYQLADIACNCVDRARRTLHIASPKVALLSYSTMGSERGAGADKVRRAVQILSDRNVDFLYDGEMEADVALVPAYAADWAPRSPVAGQADVLVFPDLNTGNICCKMLEHVAGAKVLGPLLQGLAKPVMDLSRASTVDTIVDTIVICCCDA
ncbi:phosphate acetyltransferase [Megasphaera elsdenii CAG:570]|nr:phosphate acetyltransferase [Megasphaera elsdenii CAG:570]